MVTMLVQCRDLLVPRDVFQGPRGMWVDSIAGRANRSGQRPKLWLKCPLRDHSFTFPFSHLFNTDAENLQAWGQCWVLSTGHDDTTPRGSQFSIHLEKPKDRELLWGLWEEGGGVVFLGWRRVGAGGRKLEGLFPEAVTSELRLER